MTPSKYYTKLPPLNKNEKQTLTCNELNQESDKINQTITDIGEVSTVDEVASKIGIAGAIFRATLGGFNSEDLQTQVDVNEHQEAIDKAKERLKEVEVLKVEKNCSPLTTNDSKDTQAKIDATVR